MVPSHKVPSVPALTTRIGLICMVKKSEITTGQIPVPTAVKVTVTVPLAPALGIITGGIIGKTFGIPVPL